MLTAPLEDNQNLIEDYWEAARRPLVSLIFLLPLLVIYEYGVLVHAAAAPELIRNGADNWMRSHLQSIGLGHALLLPAIVVAGLLIWHCIGGYSWRIERDMLLGMCAESLLFAFLLIIAGQLQDLAFQQLNLKTLSTGHPDTARVITYLGAGIYEEFLFRLCLLPLMFGCLRLLRIPKLQAAVLAVLVTGIGFAAAHHVGPAAENFQLFTFTFRAVAGCFFAALFHFRGFGITVGCHAAYDLLVGVILV
ncbi:MAG: CPBP family intramembrane glutamic endopeptidase [Planctomycetaceae bacterium]